MADLVVGATVTVSGGKYDGRTGRVTSVAEKSCKLSIDDAETISITKAQLAVAIGSVLIAAAAADAANAAADAAAGTDGPSTSEDPLAVGAMVTVTGGKYDGRTGRVTSVADKSIGMCSRMALDVSGKHGRRDGDRRPRRGSSAAS